MLELELRDLACKYLYSTEQEISVLDEKSLEELLIPKSVVKDSILNLLEDGVQVKLRLAQEKPVGLILPRISKCTVTEILETNEGTDKK